MSLLAQRVVKGNSDKATAPNIKYDVFYVFFKCVALYRDRNKEMYQLYEYDGNL